MRANVVAFFSLLSSLASALDPPNYPGLRTLWAENFAGGAGSRPNTGRWNIITNVRTNNEVQDYTESSQNLQLSGGGTLQIVPRNNGGRWTSGRIETKATFTPEKGKVTVFEGVLRFGDNPTDRKQGIWPAFWMLGDSIHHGTPWPNCGELDIMETINGVPATYGTVHCGSFPGGPCNEPVGRAQSTGISPTGWHTYTVRINRQAGNWRDEFIQWERDGEVYHTLTGAAINDEGVWGTLAHSPLFILLNVAVGGDWPGMPNGATADGYGSMMEVEYVAVYST
ncbi:concanavalin A-like lectin/glucanase domain-containing protein [Podospora australis]|uniref:Concanavalin A-like lectin/glucanase domain-containing protein n=1 Tax=Podospora australis TaxID=1536484 RepID=A0AAN6WQ10_9PEZI|nr:concanavalin A-like lectin/glucanase domain-containing protein [Podospora australis]